MSSESPSSPSSSSQSIVNRIKSIVDSCQRDKKIIENDVREVRKSSRSMMHTVREMINSLLKKNKDDNSKLIEDLEAQIMEIHNNNNSSGNGEIDDSTMIYLNYLVYSQMKSNFETYDMLDTLDIPADNNDDELKKNVLQCVKFLKGSDNFFPSFSDNKINMEEFLINPFRLLSHFVDNFYEMLKSEHHIVLTGSLLFAYSTLSNGFIFEIQEQDGQILNELLDYRHKFFAKKNDKSQGSDLNIPFRMLQVGDQFFLFPETYLVRETYTNVDSFSRKGDSNIYTVQKISPDYGNIKQLEKSLQDAFTEGDKSEFKIDVFKTASQEESSTASNAAGTISCLCYGFFFLTYLIHKENIIEQENKHENFNESMDLKDLTNYMKNNMSEKGKANSSEVITKVIEKLSPLN